MKHIAPYLKLLVIAVMLRFDGFGALAQTNPLPNIQWTRDVGNGPNVYGGAIAVDALRNTYTTGSFHGTGTIGGTNLVSHGGADIYLARA